MLKHKGVRSSNFSIPVGNLTFSKRKELNSKLNLYSLFFLQCRILTHFAEIKCAQKFEFIDNLRSVNTHLCRLTVLFSNYLFLITSYFH